MAERLILQLRWLQSLLTTMCTPCFHEYLRVAASNTADLWPLQRLERLWVRDSVRPLSTAHSCRSLYAVCPGFHVEHSCDAHAKYTCTFVSLTFGHPSIVLLPPPTHTHDVAFDAAVLHF